ncbi:MAG: para-aminobenzoate synthetase [Solirubrobacterales bacterium]|jgi:para-aminobenzoate synthetase|nr:para-aminobenzoate synthetase [Solirubrobacterales bacterium]
MSGASEFTLEARLLDVLPDPERLFTALYGESSSAFWLDSCRPGPSARFSFMGDASGPFGRSIAQDVGSASRPILDHLGGELGRLAVRSPDLPFDFNCGFVGYLGYELKGECGGATVHRSPHPDAALVFAARMIALDHELGHSYLLCLAEPGGVGEAERWLEETAARLSAIGTEGAPVAFDSNPRPPRDLDLRLARSRGRYLEDIGRCQELLLDGESYEICLTNSVSASVEIDPLELYRRLRRVNPAPHAAYMRFGDLTVLSSSPERFLAVDRDGAVEAKPIKGTARRDPDPAADALLAAALAGDEKNRAENLMIVDLIRNDLGSVCAMGSVEVPSLMAVESFETVHQLVSTVRGRLRAGLGATDCIRACFPPGSMTGAPKLRTTEIIDELEGAARGVYSGAIGYLGLSGGCDLSVAIRTIVLADGTASVGAGGAIVLGSDPEQEWEEMLLKAAAPLRAIDPRLDPATISLTDQRRAAGDAPPASLPDPTS